MSGGRELEKYLKARRKAYETNNLTEAASICNIIGVHYTEQGDHEKALRYHREELNLSESINDKVGVAVAHRKVGECLADLCQFSKSLEHEELYLTLAQSLDNKEETQRAYATIGRVWYMKYKSETTQDRMGGAECLDKARQAFICGLKSCDELEGILKEKEVTEMRARLYLNLGLLAEEQKDIKTAEQYYQKTCQLGKDSSSYPLVWQSLFNLGELLVNTNAPNRALILYEESLRYAQMIKSKQNEADSLLQMATVHIQLMDFLAAKHHLKKALKLNMWTDHDYRQVVFKYKVVCKVLRLSSDVTNVPVDCVEERMKLYDQLGDICAHKDLQFYNAAIKFYKMELQLAEDHGLEPKQLSQIYFSIAETHCDNGQYTDALHYYNNELELWQDHPTEAATTWANIARVYEAAQERSKVMEAYNKAVNLATIGSAYNVLGDVYRSMITFCENHPELQDERVQRSDELSQLVQEHPEINESQNSPSLQEATPLNSQDMDEELLLSSSESEDEEVTMINSTHTRQLRGVAVRKKSKVSKRNEKGETPLHVACIEGHLARVEQLLSDGADINARDYCGWTPLHEASNHGYADIVKCLLDHGANIDDCGGEKCQQTSSLMDAAINGHIDVVCLLIERGIKLYLKNDEGFTALGLIEKYITEHRECDEHITIRDILEQEMVHQGLQLLVEEAKQLRGGAKKGRHCSFDKKGVVNDEDTPPIAIVHHCHIIYELNSLLPSPSLIEDEEEEESEDCQLVDNWLLNDMGPPHKRRRTHGQTNTISRSRSLNNVTSTLRGTQSIGRDHSERYSRHRDTIDSGCGHSKFSKSIDSGCGPSQHESNDPVDGVEPQFEDDNDVIMMQSDIPSSFNDVATPTFPEQCYVQQVTQSSVLRVKVHMESSIYLVPCPWQQEDGSDSTVDWLIKKTSERYFLQHGRQPIISLTSQGGALLCPTDPVCQVLQEGEEVVGVIDHWETPPLHQHYQNVCERFKSGVHSKVLQIFQTFSSSSLDLNNIGLQPTHFPILCHTLLAQSMLTSLNLSGNLLTDSSCHHLTGLLHKLPLLHNLDLSCTGLSHQGLLLLAQPPSVNDCAKLSLQCLNLSYNNLGPCSGSSLSLFLSLTPNLSHLYLEDCNLSEYTLEAHTGLLNTLKSLDKLQILSLAYNTLDNSNYILSWLSNVPLTRLDMTSCLHGLTSSNCIKLTSSLVQLNLSCCQLGDIDMTYLTPSLSLLSYLQALILSGNHFTTSGALHLSECLPHLSNLIQIDLSGNGNLGNNGCLTILESLLKISQIRQVVFMSCGLKSPLPQKLYMCVERCRWSLLDISANPIINDDDKSKLITCSNNINTILM